MTERKERPIYDGTTIDSMEKIASMIKDRAMLIEVLRPFVHEFERIGDLEGVDHLRWVSAYDQPVAGRSYLRRADFAQAYRTFMEVTRGTDD